MSIVASARSPLPRNPSTPRPASLRRSASHWRFGVACRDALQAEGIRGEILRTVGLHARAIRAPVEAPTVLTPLIAALLLLAALAMGLWWPSLGEGQPPGSAWPLSFGAWPGSVGTAGAVLLAITMASHLARQAWLSWSFDRHACNVRRRGQVVLTMDDVDLAQQAVLLPLLMLHGERWWAVELPSRDFGSPGN